PNAAEIPRQRDRGTHGVPFFFHLCTRFQVDVDTCTDLSLPAIATLLAEFLAELDLQRVTLVCNDWGGAQLVISPGGYALNPEPGSAPMSWLCRREAVQVSTDYLQES
ncbi:MAG: hypothetical protein OXG52_05110, partial [bacterium]|nr:hypothetical protein [bacterium]